MARLLKNPCMMCQSGMHEMCVSKTQAQSQQVGLVDGDICPCVECRKNPPPKRERERDKKDRLIGASGNGPLLGPNRKPLVL